MNIEDKIINNGLAITQEELEKKKYFEEEIVPNCNFGDIIFAQNLIGENNIIRPFVVIGKENNKLICSFCNGREDIKGNLAIGEDYKLFRTNYKKTYTTIFKAKTIDYVSFERKGRTLKEEDKQRILKKMKLDSGLNYITYSDLGAIKKLTIGTNVQFEPGDVILVNFNDCLILDKNGDKLICAKLNNYNRHTSHIDNIEENIDFSDIFYVIPIKNAGYVNTLSINDFKEILRRYVDYDNKQRIESLEKNNNLIKGCVVKIEDKYYYVYDIDSTNVIVYLLNRIKKGTNYTIDINGIDYAPNYSNYKIINISNNKNYKIIGILTEFQIQQLEKIIEMYLPKKEEKTTNKKKILQKLKKL